MARLCEFIKPVYQSEKGPTCPDRNFALYKERGRCDFCPKKTFNHGIHSPAFDNIVDGYFASKAVSLRRSALRNN